MKASLDGLAFLLNKFGGGVRYCGCQGTAAATQNHKPIMVVLCLLQAMHPKTNLHSL